MSLGLGLDTGGTFTDAVIMDLSNGKVIDKAKSLTTREDLSLGIRGAISALNCIDVSGIGLVSLSTTLATNSVVEGKGCRVALLCMGSDYDRSVPADFTFSVSGSHDRRGKETEPLDEDAVRGFLESIRGKVDGLAISGYMAVRNPEHEVRVREISREILGIPSICGHELSSSLGFNERSATCVMNARLVHVIDDLITSVRAVLDEMEIGAPLMIVRGDGSMMSEEVARHRPVETILSGPAASLTGAMHLTGLRDAVVMDMGGTTTDIGILRGGRPRLDAEGAIIGGKRTRVIAAEIATSGIGGDSRIYLSGRRVSLSPSRVYPVCMAACRWQSVRDHMGSLERLEPRPIPEALGEDGVVLDCEMFRTLRMPAPGMDVSETDRRLLELVSDRPMSLNDAGARLGMHPFVFNIRRLETLGLIQRIGVTPTDILHVEGSFTSFDAEASREAVGYLARRAGADIDSLVSAAKRGIRDRMCRALLAEMLRETTGSAELGRAGEALVDLAISGSRDGEFSCSVGLNRPIIGMGAPAGVYVRWVGEVFGTEVLVHRDSDVGNAVGAIASSVSESVEFLVRPAVMGDETGRFEAFSRLGTFSYDSMSEALDDCGRRGREAAAEMAERSGAEDVVVTVERDDRRFEIGSAEVSALMEIRLRVTAAGRPRMFGVS